MAHSLKLNVVAEGVETEEQLEFLRSQQCDEMQGYLFSPPVPAEAFSKLLREEHSLFRNREAYQTSRIAVE
jgi:EAL domain-containing protein (putative c-di-GMP-specific phosphodiesterase class I)